MPPIRKISYYELPYEIKILEEPKHVDAKEIFEFQRTLNSIQKEISEALGTFQPPPPEQIHFRSKGYASTQQSRVKSFLDSHPEWVSFSINSIREQIPHIGNRLTAIILDELVKQGYLVKNSSFGKIRYERKPSDIVVLSKEDKKENV